jgi:hypothetical protein
MQKLIIIPRHGLIRLQLRLLICILSLLPAALQAEAGWLVKPSLLAAEVYDDNIFFEPVEPREDNYLRLSPALEAGYHSPSTAFNAYYSLDSLHYNRYAELDDNQTREHSELNFSHEATPLLTLMTDASYIQTRTPGELDPQIGLELGRVEAERLFFSPTAVYEFNRVTTGTASYAFNSDEVSGGIGSDTHILGLRMDRRSSRRNTLHFGYRLEEFEFDGDQSFDMHVLLAGATHEFTPRTSLTLLAGPRFSDDEDDGDSVDPEVAVLFGHAFNRGDFSLGYNRAETAILGVAGTATTQNLSASYVRAFGTSVGMRLEAGFVTSELNGLKADGAIADAEINYRLNDYLTLIGAYEFNSQSDSLLIAGFGDIDRNVVWLGVVIAPPMRTDSAWWRRGRATSTVFEEPTLRRRESRPDSEMESER